MPYKIALLIDAENVSYRDLPRFLKAAQSQGSIALAAVYGDWNKPNLQKWLELARAQNFKIRHQTSVPNVKNTSDMKLIMDAMEILYRTSLRVFCLVTNDADYVALCEKIRRAGGHTIGLGYRSASEALIRACDMFIFIQSTDVGNPLYIAADNSVHSSAHATKPPAQATPALSQAALSEPPPAEPEQKPNLIVGNGASAVAKPSQKSSADLPRLILNAFGKTSSDVHGWVSLSELGTAISQLSPGFNTSKYGHANLSKLLQSLPNLVELRDKNNVRQARLLWSRSALIDLLRRAFKAASSVDPREGGWVSLSALGSTLSQISPSFKAGDYGCSTLSKLLLSLPNWVEVQDTADGTKMARLKDA